MRGLNNKGLVLAFALLLVLIFFIFSYSFYYLAFSSYNLAILDGQRLQAYYNANSGVEYAEFVIDHPQYYPPFVNSNYYSNPTNPPLPIDYTNWPKSNWFYCLASDQSKGTVTISIKSDKASGYNISSTGKAGNVTMTINAHYAGGIIGVGGVTANGGVIDSWN